MNIAQNRFWESLTGAPRALLQETDELLPADAESAPVDDEAKDGKRAQAPPNQRFRETASVIAQPETGLVAVRATSRQHARVQEFLDSSVRSARRQVMIEATVAEVELSDGFEQGINWNRIRRGASSQFGFTLRPGGSTPSLPGGTPVSGVVPTLGLIEFADSSSRTDIAAAVRLLESFGRTRVLSSPKISALNNQTALIKVVENLVYFQLRTDFTPGVAGSPTTFTVTSTPSSVPVGFLINVTPQISANDEIVLNLRPTISRLNGFVEDPCLGELFKYRTKRGKKSELVIFLRPVIIHDPSLEGDYAEFRDMLPDAQFLDPPHERAPR